MQATRVAAISAAAFIFSAPATAAPTLVSSTADGEPLVSGGATSLFENYGISANGQFVLLGDPLTCTVYRKDRISGALLTVLETDVDGYSWCNGAKLSGDGNLVAAAPTQNVTVDCTEQREDENGNLGCSLGNVTELVVKNIASGTTVEVTRELVSQSSGDISRIPYPSDGPIAYAANLEEFAGDGGHAITSSRGVTTGVVATQFRLLDVAAGTSVPLQPPLASDAQSATLISVSISNDGNRLALLANISTPANPPADVDCYLPPITILPADVADSSGEQAAYWQYGYNPVCRPTIEGPDVFVWDRAQTTVTNLTANTGDHVLPEAYAPVIAGNGEHVAWFNLPTFCAQPDAATGLLGYVPCDAAGNVCTDDSCETQIVLANLSSGTRRQINAADPESNICTAQNYGLDANLDGNFDVRGYADCGLELSDNGQHVLFARSISYPFGGDWNSQQPILTPYLPTYTCVERASLLAGEPVFVDCPNGPGFPDGPVIGFPGPQPSGPQLCDVEDLSLCPLQPPAPTLNDFFSNGQDLGNDELYSPLNTPLEQYNKTVVGFYGSGQSLTGAQPAYYQNYPVQRPFPQFRAPLTWHLYDDESQYTTLVSLADDGQLIHANTALLAGDGTAWSFASRDPRLQDMSADEATLANECFWSPPGVSSNLRVSTNDNTTLGLGTEDIAVYPELPVFCPVPDPALPRHVYAATLNHGVNLAIMTYRNWRGGPGEMHTWLGNFSMATATHAAVTLTISGLGTDGAVQVTDAPDCTVYAATDAAVDDTFTVRCELATMASYKFRRLQWSISGSGRIASVRSSIEGNELELRPHSNKDSDLVVLQRPIWRNWFSRLRGVR